MEIQNNISLRSLNTFGIDAIAEKFASFNDVAELLEILSAIKKDNSNVMVLGGGSNVLFTKNIEGWVIKNNIPGFTVIEEDEQSVIIEAGAGMSWHGFVLSCIDAGYGGVENLALIPGNVGASPMQNIGAYGVEIKDVFHSLKAIEIATGNEHEFSKSDCEFGYRESIFKGKLRDQFVITSVAYKLSKQHTLNTSYGAIEDELQNMKVEIAGIKDVARAVMNIRQSKLPDPAVIGNAGSFFKNPEISEAQFKTLKKQFSSLPGYALPDGRMKVPAGWLIEQCGWKGYRKGDAGCHSKQALVLVNFGNAHGNEILQLSNEIISSVQEKFNITLHREVNII